MLLGLGLLALVACRGEGQTGSTDDLDLAEVARTGDYHDLKNAPHLAAVATSGDYNDLENLPELFDGDYDGLADVALSGDYEDLENAPDLADVATSGDYDDLENTPELFDGRYESLVNRPAEGVVSQTTQSLIDDGPQGAYVVVDWDGTENEVISSMASGEAALGVPILIEVPRTIPDSGGPGGHGTEALGNYVEFQHGSSIRCAANDDISYRATPNANDWRGDNAALFELLELVRVGEGQFMLTRLPEPRTGFTHGDPEHVPGTTSRTGFSWERRADGTAHLTNGTVRIPAYLTSTHRFRHQFVWPFRFEQHHGNHRCVQMGISTKSTDVYWTDLSVPRNSSTDREGMLVTVYVSPSSQHLISSGDTVSVIIMATGNWRLPSDQW